MELFLKIRLKKYDKIKIIEKKTSASYITPTKEVSGRKD